MPETWTTTEIELRPFTIRLPGEPPIRGEIRTLPETTPRSAVVVCHGFKGFRQWGFFPPLARALARAGHAAVTFDFSHNGVGDDGRDFSALDLFEQNTHTRNVREIELVVDATATGRLTGTPFRTIGLFGHSRGGGEAVLAAADDPRIAALVTWAAIASVERWSEDQVAAWERGERVIIPNSRTNQEMPIGPAYWHDLTEHRDALDILTAAGRVRCPWRVIHGTDDESVSAKDARALAGAAQTGDLVEIEGASHTFGAKHPFEGTTPHLREAVNRTIDWFGRNLPD